YYVGVSGRGNLPGTPGGYDPVAGTLGLVGLNQPGGPFPFQLSLVADLADAPTSLVRFSLIHVDPLTASPTGMTLTFSGPIDPTSLITADGQLHSLRVVDTSGWSWPISVAGYQGDTHTLTVLVDQNLPAGDYRLEVSSPEGLTDLAGRTLV